MRPAFLVLLTCILLDGCSVGPNFKKPAAPTVGNYTAAPLTNTTTVTTNVIGGEAQRLVSGQDIPFDWWKAFQSPELNKLVEQAIRANPTIDAANAALRQAQELVYAQQGYYYPQIGVGYNFERQQLAGNLGGNSPGVQGNGSIIQTFSNPKGPPPFNGPVTFDFHTAAVTVGYVVDVWGLNRRAIESLAAQAQQQRFALDAAFITLSANVVGAAINEASLRGQIAATRELIDVNRKAVGILRSQFEKGYARSLDVIAQEAQLAQVEATLPPLLKQLAQQRDALAVLVGRFPSEDPAAKFELSSLKLPQDLPVSLPSKLVEQRPDVRQAEENMHSASALLGVAIANRLPQFTLSAAGGGTASKFERMFSTGGPFWNFIGNVSQPLFTGGTLLHRQRAAKQALIQASAQYRSTVLTAFQNVADTLNALDQDATGLQTAAKAERLAKDTLDQAQAQLQTGYVNYLALISAEASYQQALIALVQAQANRYGDTAALFLALGGGWWNEPDLSDKKPERSTVRALLNY